MPFAASVAAATAIATASYCVTNGAHVNRAHAATDTRDEVSDLSREGNACASTTRALLPRAGEPSERFLPRARARGNKSEPKLTV